MEFKWIQRKSFQYHLAVLFLINTSNEINRSHWVKWNVVDELCAACITEITIGNVEIIAIYLFSSW